MSIAIIGWGSLVWDPGSLKDHLENNAKFEQGGPELPIEFSRVSDDGRLTLVIDEDHGRKVTTFVATSSRSELLDARDDLMHREKTTERYIGFTDRSGKQTSFGKYPDHRFAHGLIMPWLQKSGFDAVLWTALPPKFDNFSVEKAISYLENLPEASRKLAFEYIQKAPKEVETPVRKLFNERLEGKRAEVTTSEKMETQSVPGAGTQARPGTEPALPAPATSETLTNSIPNHIDRS